MSASPFHLGWFYSKGFGPKAWNETWAGPKSAIARFTKPDLAVDLARSIERAGFDYLMIEDSSNVPYTYQGSHDAYLRNALDTPKLDPTVLATYVAQATTNLGVVVTCSTTEYPPFLLARKMNTLDHVTDGRIGWNVVTGSNDGGAQNYGLERQYPHDERYDMADEFMELTHGLWNSWERDAVVLDQEAHVFADPSKVHAINYEGKYFRSRGPLSAPQSPQGSPVICQAGGSARGKRFASQWAETIICTAPGVEAMKAYRADIRAQATLAGRDPDSIKMLFVISPVVADTVADAKERRLERERAGARDLESGLASLSRLTGIDFAQFDLDAPLPEMKTNGHQSYAKALEGKVLREILSKQGGVESVKLTGTCASVADEMDDIMAEVGGDGFLFMNSYFTRRYVTEICDGLVPELQKRGLTRSEYEHDLFRDNLMAF